MMTLSIRVSQATDTVRYFYELRSSDGTATGPLEQEYSVDVNQSLVAQLCERIDVLLADARESGGEELVRLCQTLYDHLFRPASKPELLAGLLAGLGNEVPLLIRTNEMLVPWELLHDGTGFLGLRTDVGRHSIVEQRISQGRSIGAVERALIVGDPLGDLPAAREEATHVAQLLTARGVTCTVLLGEEARLADVVMELRSPYDLFHFCGHVAVRHGSSYTGLLLHQRELLDKDALATILAVGAPPIAFINGCSAAGRVANMCLSFMVTGSKTVIGTRTDVSKDGAQRFAEAFYRRLLHDRATTGAAVREARASIMDGMDHAWASFLLFGDPGMAIPMNGDVATNERPPANHRDVDDDVAEMFAPDAADLMRAAADAAATRGVITSIELLAGLLAIPALRAEVEKAVGPMRAGALIELLQTLIRDSPGSTPGHRPIQLSDTVVNVFAAAKRRADLDGRLSVTSHDIAAAFVESGGGSSAHLLELCEIPLRRILPATPQAMPAVSSALFDESGRLRAETLTPVVATALRFAQLLADAGNERIGTYTLLRCLALAGSPVLRQSMSEHGDAGEQALHRLRALPSPRLAILSDRTRTALEAALSSTPRGKRVGDAELLRALLSDDGSSARTLLRRLGVSPEHFLRSLRQES